MIIKNCKQCGKDFTVPLCWIKKGGGKFCSRKCHGIWKSANLQGAKSPAWRGGGINKNCLICNKEFIIKKCDLKKGGGKFCSRKCCGKWNSDNLKGEKHPSWKGGKISRSCLVCDRKFKVNNYRIIHKEANFCSTACSNKKRVGEKSGTWKGGITPINLKIRNSLEYKIWRASVFERDNYMCCMCKAKNVYLEADHIKPFSIFVELRFDINNGRTLCINCHKKTDTYGAKIHTYKIPFS